MGNASQINRSRNSVRVERKSDLNESDLGEVYCTLINTQHYHKYYLIGRWHTFSHVMQNIIVAMTVKWSCFTLIVRWSRKVAHHPTRSAYAHILNLSNHSMKIIPGLLLCWMNIFVTFQSRVFFAWSQAFAGISLASSGLMTSPPRSYVRLDDDHMTPVVHRRWRDLMPLVAVHDRLSYFYGFSHFSL